MNVDDHEIRQKWDQNAHVEANFRDLDGQMEAHIASYFSEFSEIFSQKQRPGFSDLVLIWSSCANLGIF